MAGKLRYSKISTGFLCGIAGILSDIEVSIVPGLPSFEIVGLCDSAIRESRNRVRSAIRHAGYTFPAGRITVGISPAYLHKSGTSVDLPLAICILCASEQLLIGKQTRIYAFGELTLTGNVLDVPGSLPRLSCAIETPFDYLLIPSGAVAEARLMSARVNGVFTLREAILVLSGKATGYVCSQETPESGRMPPMPEEREEDKDHLDFSLLKGQEKTARAILLSASGFHNILLSGSPGCGKTMSARILHGILPPLTENEKLDTLKIRNINGVLSAKDLQDNRRPFRYVHQTCSSSAMAGGGASLLPGELSLAHNGVLFLDEMAEFSPRVLDLLRQPLEENQVTLSRPGSVIVYPSRFLLVGAMNPCKCGNYLENRSACICSESQRRQYANRVSGPILDRIDIFSEMRRIDKDALLESIHKTNHKLSDMLREQVGECWSRQYVRCDTAGLSRVLNGANPVREITEFFRVSKKAEEYAVASSERFRLSARGMNRLLRVARTVADLSAESDVSCEHIAEALQFRRVSE